MKLILAISTLITPFATQAEITKLMIEDDLIPEIQTSRNGNHISTTLLNSDGSPFRQTIFLEGKTVITVQYDRKGRFEYRMIDGFDGIKLFSRMIKETERISITIPKEGKAEAFDVQENGLLVPASDEVLKGYKFIDFGDGCIAPTEEAKDEENKATHTTSANARHFDNEPLEINDLRHGGQA